MLRLLRKSALCFVLLAQSVLSLPPKKFFDLASKRWHENPDQDLIHQYGSDAFSRYVSIEPINEERVEMLKELFNAIFITAKTCGSKGTHEIRALLENHWGYISRTDVDYIFGLCGFLSQQNPNIIESLKHGIPTTAKVKAKMPSLKLYNRLFFNFEHEMNARQVVQIIKEHTGKDLPLTEQYMDKYGY